HGVGSEPGLADLAQKRPHPERPRSNEKVAARVRKGLGAAPLIKRNFAMARVGPDARVPIKPVFGLMGWRCPRLGGRAPAWRQLADVEPEFFVLASLPSRFLTRSQRTPLFLPHMR